MFGLPKSHESLYTTFGAHKRTFSIDSSDDVSSLKILRICFIFLLILGSRSECEFEFEFRVYLNVKKKNQIKINLFSLQQSQYAPLLGILQGDQTSYRK